MQIRRHEKSKKNSKSFVFSLFTLIFILLIGSNNYSILQTSYAKESSNFFSDFFKNHFNENKIPSHSLEVASENTNSFVVPMGIPIGIKLTTEGVLVTGFSQSKGDNDENISPAKSSGIQIGDIILYVNDKIVESAEQISDLVKTSNGEALHISVKRNNDIIMFDVSPVYSQSAYKLGMYVRNISAGIGTLTFVNPNTKTFAALGHGITDTDTGKILNLSQGAITNSYILSAVKGEKGKAGELRGILSPDSPNTGNITTNNEMGVYGRYNSEFLSDHAMQIANIDEITTGPATILTTIAGMDAGKYDVEIVKIIKQTKESQKSMVIRVTDPRLLAKTGGIVQGMSGSPIIQNDKLVGAITHVFVNDPTYGYGIFAKWMEQETMQIAS